jgi:membrane-bound lytic murein transglycosylase F
MAMISKILCGVACVLFIFSGCTPLGDGALRKSVTEQEGRVQGQVERGGDETAAQDVLIDPTTGAIIRLYGPVIKHYSMRYGLDWRLVLATMKQESRFAPEAKSGRGASGLMQIMPVTGEELARVLDMEDMSRPHDNIRAGVYYLRRLYDLFPGAEDGDRMKLALAAYNAGIGRIYDAQEIAAYFHQNPLAWESIKDVLPLLARRHSPLHRSVWQQDHPRSGWFGNAGQTVKYVESVMNNFDEYRLMLN